MDATVDVGLVIVDVIVGLQWGKCYCSFDLGQISLRCLSHSQLKSRQQIHKAMTAERQGEKNLKEKKITQLGLVFLSPPFEISKLLRTS
jgi:hypothetical protein